MEMISMALTKALEDAGCRERLTQVDEIACSGLTVDAKQVNTPVSGLVKNVPLAVSKQVGIKANHFIYAEAGGNTPQMLVNHYCKKIARGECETVALAGGEALHTMNLRFNHWTKILRPKGKWKDKSGEAPTMIGDAKDGNSDYEGKYWMNLPANVYPLFENALRANNGRNIEEHQQYIAKLFSNISQKAAENPYAWFNKAKSAEEILEQSLGNRTIAFPYRKRLNSMIMVNQSAACIVTSVEKAKALGINPEKWVFLHGYADGNDIWNVSERQNYYSSPAIKSLGEAAFSMANKNLDDIAAIDIYSCFPSAVQVACDALGLSHFDSRGLSLTGGLPYFGGPGNNYSMHAVVEMVNWARQNENEFGFLNANGWYLTKHSMGIYSKKMPSAEFKQSEPIHQDSNQAPVLNQSANGDARIETYTVLYNRNDQPEKAIIIARMKSGERCLATTDNKDATLEQLLSHEAVGLEGVIRSSRSKALFEF